MIRRTEKECNDPALLEAFLKEAPVLHMAMSVPGDAPYIVPLNFVYDNNKFYIHSAKEGRKISLLAQNPHAGFAVNEQICIRQSPDNPCATGTRYKSAVGKAAVKILTGNAEKTQALNMLLGKYTELKPAEYKEKVLEKLVIIELDIIEVAFKTDVRE